MTKFTIKLKNTETTSKQKYIVKLKEYKTGRPRIKRTA